MAVVDLFCGVGGLTHGLALEGFSVTAGVDIDETCRFAYEHNNAGATFVSKSVADLSGCDLLSYYPQGSTKIMVGCAPCRPYSSMPTKIADGKREWELLDHFASLVEEVDPEVVSMENVVQLRSFDTGRVFQNFVERLEAAGYTTSHYSVFGPDYGLPQTRRRLVFFASKRGRVELVPPTHSPDAYLTVEDVIKKLPRVDSGGVSPNDPLHRARRLGPLNLKRIRASKPGGTWHDWPEDLRADCHKKESGASYKSVYGRMQWSEPSPTITTLFHGFGNGRFGHPEQDRALTLREGAMLQTFPETYAFAEHGAPISFDAIGRHIGNAVPVDLGRVIGRSIARHLASTSNPHV